jgi:hypothetical protein
MIGHRATQLIQVNNYVNSSLHLLTQKQIEGFFLSIAWIAVGLRIYVRAYIVKAFGWDDGWMVFAQLMHTMNSTCAIGGALTGTGRFVANLTPHSMMMAMRVSPMPRCLSPCVTVSILTISPSFGTFVTSHIASP